MALKLGVTLETEDLVAWRSRVYDNQMVYIGPNADGLPASWADPRYAHAKARNSVIVAGMRLAGDSTKYETVYQHLVNLPNWITTLYLTESPEPERPYEGNHTAFLDNWREWHVEVIQRLPSIIRAKIKVGPIVSKSWTEDPGLGFDNFARFDPGPAYSDFYAMAAVQGETWTEVITAYPNPADWLSKFRDYRYSSSDARPRLVPLLGVVGLPADPSETARSNFLVGLIDQMAGWGTTEQGWPFIGASYYQGWRRGTPAVGIGPQRWYRFEVRQTGWNTKVTDASQVEADLPALLTWNLKTYVHTTSNAPNTYPGHGTLPPNPEVPPAVIELPPGGLPIDGPAAAKLLAADYTILVTDANLNVIGDPLYEWTSLQCAIRWKEPSSGTIVMPAYQYVRQQLLPAARVVVLRRLLGTQHILMAGPIEKILRERSDAGDNGGVGKLTITFVDDMVWLASRLAYPNPALPIDQQTTDYWTYAGDPEAAMLELVSKQAGPAALTARRVPKLTVAAYSGIAPGGTVALGETSDVAPRERLERLTDVLRSICKVGANAEGSTDFHPDSLGFRVRQTQIAGVNQLLFEPVRSRDLTGQVHFSFARGNLEYYSFEQASPSLTHVLIGGSGDTPSKKFLREIPTDSADALAWGRFEGYVSADGSLTLAQHTDTAVNEMADKLSSARLATSASDTVDQRFGVHYGIGDIVSVELDADEYVSGPVQTVNVQAYPTAGEVAGVTIGDQSARYDSEFAQRMRDLDRRLGRQERRLP